jgi:hypothetical protein
VVGDCAIFYVYGPDVVEAWGRLESRLAPTQLPSAIAPPEGVELRFGGLGAVHVHLIGDRTVTCL